MLRELVLDFMHCYLCSTQQEIVCFSPEHTGCSMFRHRGVLSLYETITQCHLHGTGHHTGQALMDCLILTKHFQGCKKNNTEVTLK